MTSRPQTLRGSCLCAWFAAACAAPQAAPAAVAAHPTRLLVFGDFGQPGPQRDAVVAAMRAEHRARPFDLALSLGDNLYECGPDQGLPGAAACAFGPDQNTADPAFKAPIDPRFESFEQPFEGFDPPFPVWTMLGNHDVGYSLTCMPGGPPPTSARDLFDRVGGDLPRLKACLSVAHHSARWKMPGRHFVIDAGPARVVVFDSNVLRFGDYGGFSADAEVAFVADALKGCDHKTCFLAAHHPPVSAGSHRRDADEPTYRGWVNRFETAGPFRAWLAGHEHSLQHLRAASGYDVLISGNSSQDRHEAFDPGPGAALLFSSSAWGFTVIEVSEHGWSSRFVDSKGVSLDCCEASGRGGCEPRPCP